MVYTVSQYIQDFDLWERMESNRSPVSFELEITPRCGNDCVHCYINRPIHDETAKNRELSLEEIERIAGEAVELGAVWCLVTGGDPLVRKDFSEIYLTLKRKGLMTSVFTSATLLQPDHVSLFKSYPPRHLEVSVYGVTRETYERVTRKAGSFQRFRKNLDALSRAGVPIRLKTMALTSNLSEFEAISKFCRERTSGLFRYDPMLHLRVDGDRERNREIRAQRLPPEVIIALERSDSSRMECLERGYDTYIVPEVPAGDSRRLIQCGAGINGFYVGWDGMFQLCGSLRHPDCLYDLRTGNVKYALREWVPRVRGIESTDERYLERCHRCPIVNLCAWCPAHAYLETGRLDRPVNYFCEVAHARAAMLKAVKAG